MSDNVKYSPILSGILGLLLWLSASPARSDLIPSPFLPLSVETRLSSNAFIEFDDFCSTVGTYNAGTFAWTQSIECSSGVLNNAGGQTVDANNLSATLSGFVDNSGQVIAGAFSLVGVVPELGITDASLLASGTLLDAAYGAFAGTFGGDLEALIDLNFIIGPLSGLGTILMWDSNAFVGPWDIPPTPIDLSWQVSVIESDYFNFTNTDFFFHDRGAILPEPGTLALLGIGLAGLGLTRRSKKV